MGYLGKAWAIIKVVVNDEERFIIRYEDPDSSHKAGYMFSDSGPLTEEQLRERLAEAGGTVTEIERVIREARETYTAYPKGFTVTP